MVNYYKLERELIINESSATPVKVEAGNYILTEATGALSPCTEANLSANISRVEQAIIERDAIIEAERLAEEPFNLDTTPLP